MTRNYKRGVLKKFDLQLDPWDQRLIKAKGRAFRLSPEQFRLFALLFDKSPNFITEDKICAQVFADTPSGKYGALLSLMYRLRLKLGPQLARRIKSSRSRGWRYVQPRPRKKLSRSPQPVRKKSPGRRR